MSYTGSDTPALWALADCNNFFVSCEQLFRPDLAGRPVVVLSSNDGCIVARSPEAKALGIKMGVPEFQVRALMKEHGVEVFSSNFALYGDISSRVMAALASLCPEIRQYSIDEAFIPLPPTLAKNAAEIAWALRERVRLWTGITVSVGMARTKTLAKAANHLAKRGPGVIVLDDPAALPGILQKFPVEEVWGLGRRQCAKLSLFGVRTAWAFARMQDEWLRRNFTITGLRTARELRGEPALTDDDAPAPRHSLVVSRSFGEKVRDCAGLAQAVATFTAKAAEHLRRAGLTARGIGVQIRTSYHGRSGEVYDVSGQSRLPEATNDTGVLLQAALELTRKLYREGPAYAKAGVLLFDLNEAGREQYTLFPAQNPEERARRAALMQAVDGINKRLGQGALRFGAQGGPDAAWQVRQGRRSLRATTDWNELARAKCK